MTDDNSDSSSDKDGKRSYTVGYGKPPASGRFKPGVSGNPKGRRKNIKNFETYLRDELRSKVTVNRDGRQVSLPKVGLIAVQLVNSALKGNLKSIDCLLRMVNFMGDHEGAGEASRSLTEMQRQLLTDFIDSIQNEANASGMDQGHDGPR